MSASLSLTRDRQGHPGSQRRYWRSTLGSRSPATHCKVNVIGVNALKRRSWTLLSTASNERLWNTLTAGGFVASPAARHRLRLHTGSSYPVTGAATVSLPYAGAAPLGIHGIDMVVAARVSARLGLVHHVAVLISAPSLSIGKLRSEVRAAVGHQARRWSGCAHRSMTTPPRTSGVGHAHFWSTTYGAAHHLRPAVPGVGGDLLPGAALDGARGHRPDRERGRRERGPVQRRCPRPDAVPALHLGAVGNHRIRSEHRPSRTSWIRSMRFPRLPGTCARLAARPRLACPRRSSPTTTPTGTWPRSSRSPSPVRSRAYG